MAHDKLTQASDTITSQFLSNFPNIGEEIKETITGNNFITKPNHRNQYIYYKSEITNDAWPIQWNQITMQTILIWPIKLAIIQLKTIHQFNLVVELNLIIIIIVNYSIKSKDS